MPGFLRRKTSPSKTADTETPSKKSSSSDAPPSLPPLFPSRTSHTSSSRREPESEIAPVSSPSQPGPLKENGTAGDSALLPDITPLHSSLDVDADWQDLLRFIDSPSLLADSSQETKPPAAPEKHKQSSTPGVALVTSNRYLSNAQKTRMAQERGLKLSDTAEPPRRVSPHGDKPKREESESVSKPNATSGLSVLCNGLSANNANPLRHRISSILEDQQDATTNENGRVQTTANVSAEHEANKRREGAQGPQALAAQPKFEASALAKDAKPTRKDSKTSGNGNGSFFSKVIDIREGRSGRSSAVRRSDLPNGTQIVDGSNVRPTADVTNGKQSTIDTPSNGKQATDTSNKKPRVAKDGEVLGRTTRVVSVIERSQSPLARSRSPQEPPAPQKSLSQSPPPTSRSPPPSSRSSPVMTNEKVKTKTKTRENAPGAKNEQAGKATNGMMTFNPRKEDYTIRDQGWDEELRTAGHLEQPQHHQRITQGQAHNNQVQAQQRSSNGHPPSHTHRRTASSESQGNKTLLNGYHSPAVASAQVNGNANVRLTPAPHFSTAPNSVPSAYPTPGFYPTTGYLPTSFCPSAYPNSFTPSFNVNPYNAAYGAMYNPFTPFQHFGLGPAYPSQFPSPNPQLHKAPSTASFFDAVMSGVSGIAGSQGLSGTLQQNPVQRTTTRSMSGESTASRDKDKPRVLTKVRPTPPPTPPHVAGSVHAGAHAAGSGRTGRRRSGYDEDDRVREVCALLDSDPFAKVEGVRVVTRDGRSGSVSGHGHGSLSGHGHGLISDHGHGSLSGHGHGSISGHGRDTPARPLCLPSLDGHLNSSHARASKGMAVRESHLSEGKEGGNDVLEEVEEEVPKTYFPLTAFLSNADFFTRMLEYLEFRDWLALYAVGRGAVRSLFDSVAPSGPSGGKGKNVQCNARQFREIVLERFLRPVGYAKWGYEWAEPIVLTLRDLNNYMRGISMPTHDYARFAHAYVSQPKGASRGLGNVLSLALTTRAYTKVVLRLRAQAESEAKWITRLREEHVRTCSGCSPNQATKARDEKSQGPVTFWTNGHARQTSSSGGSMSSSSGTSSCACPLPRPSFHSPLFRPNHGTWLSDVSELRRSATGVTKLLRAGDVVWDIALGDEGNIGRMVWDGGYLVDLDYRYSRLGELSPYFHSLAFPPSYFHRVIRIGASAGHNPQENPIVYVDVSPWGQEIARNLQLLQERGKAETPHGALHDVVLWVHRSSFKIHPPATTDHARVHSHLREYFPHLVPSSERRAIPNVPGSFIDPNWYGTVVVEVEGTQEGLADLQDRCGPGVFPPRPEAITGIVKGVERRRIWRVIREKSRPGEIWLRVVREKERVTW
ncbi:hypothetical protein F5141DRAFT_1087437 [Pisolithus sp. B1]|nr:hypothetical protein F5141DRAFT_1087437 [Pisolithus sp. B1]